MPHRRVHFEGHATPEGCLEYFDFNAAILDGVRTPPAETVVLKLYDEWGTKAEQFANYDKAQVLKQITLEIATFLVQKNYILRCWMKKKLKSQKEVLNTLRGNKERWSKANLARLSAALALRKWRRHILEAEPADLFAESHNATEVAFILEARRGFDANATAFAHVMVSCGLLCNKDIDPMDVNRARDLAKKDHAHQPKLTPRTHTNKKRKKRCRRFA